MSMFSSIGLADVPYMEWLLPVFIGFMGLHLLLLLRSAPRTGYLPFALSLAGLLIIVSTRMFSLTDSWLPAAGMALIVSGSVLNGLSGMRKMKATPSGNAT